MGRTSVDELLDSRWVLFSLEGGAEQVVMDKLIEADALRVPRQKIVDDPIYFTPYTRLRKADQIAQRFFATSYCADGASGLLLARIVDSRAGRFVLPRRWVHSCVVESFFTRPEIEVLVIHAEGAFKEWSRASRRNRQLRPSEFCKANLRMRDVKSPSFLERYWDERKLVDAIHAYDRHRNHASGELSLGDLLSK
ncbi:MAG: hypothetical protein IKG18_16115 [Atopobiaceae bacterium]|nr:hypothetical protein [Atopobiaceae bacterium]